MKEEKATNKDSLECGSDSDDDNFMGWDEVGLLVIFFVDLDDVMAEMMNRKLVAERKIAIVKQQSIMINQVDYYIII